MSDVPIAEHGFLSDCHSAALVTREGSVDWLCFPRFDSSSVFGRLLDEEAGHWRVGVAEATAITRRYLADTLVLETTSSTSSGLLRQRDALALGEGNRGHELGAGSPHVLLRTATCLEGEVELDVSFAPRPEYGIGRPLLDREDACIVTRGGPDRLVLGSTHPLQVSEANTASARIPLRAGERFCAVLSWSPSTEPASVSLDPGLAERQVEDTVAAWRSWSRLHQRFEGGFAEQVRRAGIVLQGLTYQPTGAIVAAATTSLPEVPGGGRNWDYRYGWIRDSSLTLDALWVAACPDEAGVFLDWLVGAAAADLHAGRPLQIMYGVGGEHDLTERELPHLRGWQGSVPVRVGNGAWRQRQLDVYGELLEAVYVLREQVGELDGAERTFLCGVADAAASSWTEPDQGIWELRGEPRHHLHSKLLCWVALDRAVRLAPWLGADARVPTWCQARDAIRRAILADGFDDEVGAFTQSFGSPVIDASALMVPIVGFLPGNDPRVRSTIRAVMTRLRDEGGFIRRYEDGSDGLEGSEGAFVMCTFWLAHALALAGELDEASEVFTTATAAANDLGLMAEEVDARSGALLGNFPQAFSHVGLATAAHAIAQATTTRGGSNGESRGNDPAPQEDS